MASIKRRSENGPWRARYRDAAGKEHARHFDRKAEAQKWLDEVTASIVTGSYVDPKAGRVTLESFYTEWAARQVWVHSTTEAMTMTVQSAPFAKLPIGQVRRSHVESWVKEMDSRGLAPATVKSRTRNMQVVFRAAVRDKVIMSSPASDIALPRERKREASLSLPSPAQVGAIMGAAEPHFRAFVALAAFAGMRLGEIAAMQVCDIDFLRRTVHVRRQVQRIEHGAVEVRAPKYNSERVVYASEGLIDILARHIEKHAPGTDTTRWLFTAASGRTVPPTTVNMRWARACSAAGVDVVRLHDLRHFYASGLIAAGCDVVTVQRALGHARPTTTLNTYGHLWPTAEDRTRSAAAALLEEVLAPRTADSVRTGGAV